MGGMLADLSKIICLLFTVILAFSLGIAKLYNSRYFYLYVDGNANISENGPELVKEDSAAVQHYHKLRSINCLYYDEIYTTTKTVPECNFTSGHIQPVLFRE